MNNLVYYRLMYIFLFLALCNSKLLNIKTALPTPISSNQADTIQFVSTDTNKLILKNYSNSGNLNSEITNNINLLTILIFIIYYMYSCMYWLSPNYYVKLIIIIKSVYIHYKWYVYLEIQ